jgi:hypothetical protein
MTQSSAVERNSGLTVPKLTSTLPVAASGGFLGRFTQAGIGPSTYPGKSCLTNFGLQVCPNGRPPPIVLHPIELSKVARLCLR